MDKKLSSFDLYYMTKELQFIVGSRIDKVFTDSNGVVFQLYNQDLKKIYLRVHSELIFLTKERGDWTDSPDGFCLFLRKHLTNSRIVSVFQMGSERILKLTISTKDKEYDLFFELFGGGNIILTVKGMILSAKVQRKYTTRTINNKLEYIYPKRDVEFTNLNYETFKLLLLNSNIENIVKSLAIDLGIGGIYAEEVVYRAGIDKNLSPSDADSKKLFDVINEMLSEDLKPNVVSNKILPIDFKSIQDEKKFYDLFYVAIDDNIVMKKNDDSTKAQSKFEKKIKKIELIIKTQSNQIKKMEKKTKSSQEKGDLIYTNYGLVEDVINKKEKRIMVVDLK